MRQWSAQAVMSPKQFLQQVARTAQGEDVGIEFHYKDLSSTLIEWHKKHYAWHHNDTIRSYTNKELRARGNRGKRTDFAYMNRAAVYFGYDQFKEHRVQRNKLICLWDASMDGDFFGEHNPCLVLVRFVEEGKELHMRAVFRKRDLLKRMIGNWTMLSMWLLKEAKVRGKEAGRICDYSMDTMYDVEQCDKLMRRK